MAGMDRPGSAGVPAIAGAAPAGRQVRLGVTGHRGPPKLPEAAIAPLRASIDSLIAAITLAAGGPAVAVVSALAEGADRLVAEAGLAAGGPLFAILPFARAEYARDFAAPTSRAAFAALLDRAVSVTELPGEASERPHAYEAAGLAMLARIDLLIAIWDGQQAAGVGGTAEIVARARAAGLPVAWLEPVRPGIIQLAASDGEPAAFQPAAPAAVAAAALAHAAARPLDQ